MQSKMADFATVPPPGELDETYVSFLILVYSIRYTLYENMATSTKPEAHSASHDCRKITEPQSQMTCTETFVKFDRVVFEKRERTDKQTDRQTR